MVNAIKRVIGSRSVLNWIGFACALVTFAVDRIGLPVVIPIIAGCIGIAAFAVAIWKWASGFQAKKAEKRTYANWTLQGVMVSLFVLSTGSSLCLFLKLFPKPIVVHETPEYAKLLETADALRDDLRKTDVKIEEKDAELTRAMGERNKAQLGEQEARNSLAQLVMLIKHGNTNIPIMEMLTKVVSVSSENNEALTKAVARLEMERPKLDLLVDGIVVTNKTHVVYTGNPIQKIKLSVRNSGPYSINQASIVFLSAINETNLLMDGWRKMGSGVTEKNGITEENDQKLWKISANFPLAPRDHFGPHYVLMTNITEKFVTSTITVFSEESTKSVYKLIIVPDAPPPPESIRALPKKL